MLGFVLWTIVLVAACAGVCACVYLAESSWSGGVLAGVRARILAAVVCLALLLLLILAYQVRAIAKPDGMVIQHLVGSPTSALVKVMNYLTLTGDSVPSFLIAAILAVVIQRQGAHRYLPLLLPVVVLAELYIQLGIGKVFDDYTIRRLFPDVPIGGVGFIPSGSVARLLSIFLVGARLWSTSDPRAARRLASLGAALTIMQILSRLILGRHLLADIAGGILLGLFLTLACTLVIDLVPERYSGARDDVSPSSRTTIEGRRDDAQLGSRSFVTNRRRLRRSTPG